MYRSVESSSGRLVEVVHERHEHMNERKGWTHEAIADVEGITLYTASPA
jgi:hypothetical protein